MKPIQSAIRKGAPKSAKTSTGFSAEERAAIWQRAWEMKVAETKTD